MLINVNHTIYIQYFHKLLKTLNKKKIIKKKYIYIIIPFMKAATLVNYFSSIGTISQILRPKYEILSLPWKRDLTFGISTSELIRKL